MLTRYLKYFIAVIFVVGLSFSSDAAFFHGLSGGPMPPSLPVVVSVANNAANGNFTVGSAPIQVTVTFNVPIVVNTTGGSPRISLNSTGTGTYLSSSGSNVVFSYAIGSGQNTAKLGPVSSSAITLNGSTIQDVHGNNANLAGANGFVTAGTDIIDTVVPVISSVIASSGVAPGGATIVSIVPTTMGLLVTGGTDVFTVNFTSAVTVTGTPTLNLSNGGVASYTGGTGTTALTFGYTVTNGQNTPIAASAANPTGNTYLGTSASALSGTFGGVLNSSGANSLIFTGLAVNTNPLYFVSPTGTDTGSGAGACSRSTPCATLNFVKNLMESNTTKTVYALAGTYNVASACTVSVVWGNVTLPSNGTSNGIPTYPTTASAVVCATSTSDNGTNYLGYPGAFPELYGGTVGTITTGLTPGVANGVNIAFVLGACCSGQVTNITVNGFKIYNFMEGFNLSYPGNMTVTNNDIENMMAAPMYPDENGEGTAAIDGPEGTWGILYIAHNTVNNVGGFGIDGPQDLDGGSGGQQAGGSLTVDSNIVLNSCQSTYDCGALYAFDSFQTTTANWTNNILASLNSVFSEQIYLDFSSSGFNTSGNQVYGISTSMMLWHSGQNNSVSNNLFDLSAHFGQTVGSNWPALSFYQGCSTESPDNCTWSEPAYEATNNNMANNSFKHNILWSSVAPFTTGCGELNCGYLWVWSQDAGQSIINPALANNNYFTTTGSFTSFGSSPSQSSPTFGVITDSSPITSNPGVSFTTGDPTRTANLPNFGERHYAFTNPPSGWTALKTGQGPH